jgi:hypothetical protein
VSATGGPARRARRCLFPPRKFSTGQAPGECPPRAAAPAQHSGLAPMQVDPSVNIKAAGGAERPVRAGATPHRVAPPSAATLGSVESREPQRGLAAGALTTSVCAEVTLSGITSSISQAPSQIRGALTTIAAADSTVFAGLKSVRVSVEKLSPTMLSSLDTPAFRAATVTIDNYLRSVWHVAIPALPSPGQPVNAGSGQARERRRSAPPPPGRAAAGCGRWWRGGVRPWPRSGAGAWRSACCSGPVPDAPGSRPAGG